MSVKVLCWISTPVLESVLVVSSTPMAEALFVPALMLLKWLWAMVTSSAPFWNTMACTLLFKATSPTRIYDVICDGNVAGARGDGQRVGLSGIGERKAVDGYIAGAHADQALEGGFCYARIRIGIDARIRPAQGEGLVEVQVSSVCPGCHVDRVAGAGRVDRVLDRQEGRG